MINGLTEKSRKKLKKKFLELHKNDCASYKTLETHIKHSYRGICSSSVDIIKLEREHVYELVVPLKNLDKQGKNKL